MTPPNIALLIFSSCPLPPARPQVDFVRFRSYRSSSVAKALTRTHWFYTCHSLARQITPTVTGSFQVVLMTKDNRSNSFARSSRTTCTAPLVQTAAFRLALFMFLAVVFNGRSRRFTPNLRDSAVGSVSTSSHTS
ncbi:hypothetical protein JAAARDRAFT_474784 [Jaapia argillacea MUCL 33604]|uniref:Uncharacterized protein n=1 Tax=Jaapia argillacea MUCL 33604 TaxID=933084 RepID=A0A067PFU1_9AGAM|nr:hypothetical protein JAAARDRAFT_474784 [Jaapia argillacea MUCL 33604]